MSFRDQRSPRLLIKFLKETGVNVELFCTRANAKTRDGAVSPRLGETHFRNLSHSVMTTQFPGEVKQGGNLPQLPGGAGGKEEQVS